MNIIETSINDIPINDKSKENLADKIIEQLQPLFNKEYISVIKEIKKIKIDTSLKQKQIKVEKEELEKISKSLEKKKKENVLLNRIGKLVYSGLIQDSMKRELVILLKTFDSMDETKINNYLNETMQIISRKFAKS